MLTRLKINRFPRFESGIELNFSENFNVLLGKNGSGKTTLLELISAVCRLDFSGYDLRDVDLEFSFLSKNISVEGRVKTDTDSLSDRVASPFDYMANGRAENAELSLELNVVFGDKGMKLFSGFEGTKIQLDGDEFVQIRNLNFGSGVGIWRRIVTSYFRAVNAFEPLAVELVQLSASRRFGEGLENYLDLKEKPYFIYFLDGAVHELDGTVIEFLNNEGVHEGAKTVSYTEAQIPWLADLATRFSLQNGTVDFDFSKQVYESDSGSSEVFQLDDLRLRFTAKNGSDVKGDNLSYGQKRLFAFYWYYHSTNIIIADELINGFHREWIKSCIDILENRQSFLSSQNPLLLDHLGFDDAEEVTKTLFHLSSNKKGSINARNLSREESEKFFAAYEVGIQTVSEVLEAKGLW